MDVNLLEKWRKFSLTEDEAPGLEVEADAMGNSMALGSNYLLGRLITDRLFNREAFKSSMLRLWGVTRGITVKDIGENLFVFQFTQAAERNRVLKGSPWLFDNYLLALTEFDGSCPASHIQFNRCYFWVQIHRVPLYYMTKETDERVGGTLGNVVSVDVPEHGVGWGPFLRVRLSLDITKPILRGHLVTFHAVGQLWISFKYERLPWICFHCGVIGHLERDCDAPARSSGGTMVGDEVKQYGAWLRAAEPMKRRRAVVFDRVQKAVPARRRDGKGKVDNLNSNTNRHADFVGDTTSSASNMPAKEKGVHGFTVPEKVPRMDMHDVEQQMHVEPTHPIALPVPDKPPPTVSQKASFAKVSDAPAGVPPIIAGLKSTAEQVTAPTTSLPKGPLFSETGFEHRLPRESHEAAQVEPKKQTRVPQAKMRSTGPEKMKGKMKWKRLAREVGKTSVPQVELSKRSVDASGVGHDPTEMKRFKRMDDSQVLEDFSSVEAVHQPRREP